jgi:hypothetical protein
MSGNAPVHTGLHSSEQDKICYFEVQSTEPFLWLLLQPPCMSRVLHTAIADRRLMGGVHCVCLQSSLALVHVLILLQAQGEPP